MAKTMNEQPPISGFFTRTLDNIFNALDVAAVVVVGVDVAEFAGSHAHMPNNIAGLKSLNLIGLKTFFQIALSKFARLTVEQEVIGNCSESNKHKTLFQEKVFCVEQNTNQATILKTATGALSGFMTGKYLLTPKDATFFAKNPELASSLNHGLYELSDGLVKSGSNSTVLFTAHTGAIAETLDTYLKGGDFSGFVSGLLLDNFFEPIHQSIDLFASIARTPLRMTALALDSYVDEQFFSNQIMGNTTDTITHTEL